MVISRKTIQKALKKKGFIEDNTGDHFFYFLEYEGKLTSIFTKISRGSKYKDYDISLLKLIREQLHFDSLEQMKSFFDCPMRREEYLKNVIKKGIISG